MFFFLIWFGFAQEEPPAGTRTYTNYIFFSSVSPTALVLSYFFFFGGGGGGGSAQTSVLCKTTKYLDKEGRMDKEHKNDENVIRIFLSLCMVTQMHLTEDS